MVKRSCSDFHHLLKVDLLLKQSGKLSLFGAALAAPPLSACSSVEQCGAVFQLEALEALRGSVYVGALGFWRLPASPTVPHTPQPLSFLTSFSSLVSLGQEPRAYLWDYSLPAAPLPLPIGS